MESVKSLYALSPGVKIFMLDNFIKKIQVKNKQRSIDKRYEKEGISDALLEEQIEVNKIRNEFNIPDEKELVYEEFVQ